MDFLRFHPKSILSNGNKLLFEHLRRVDSGEEEIPQEEKGLFDEMEDWEDWKDFPNFTPMVDLTKGPAVELLAWLLDSFGPIVTHCKLKESGNAFDTTDLLANMTLDDFVFTFVQVQHNINKWNLVYKAWKNKYIDGWKDKECVDGCEYDRKHSEDDKKKLTKINLMGYEYPPGSGCAGKYGKLRYNSLTKFFFDAYYDKDSSQVKQNRAALKAALNKLAEERESEEQDDKEEDRASKRQRCDAANDSKLNQIHEMMWGDFSFADIPSDKVFKA